MYVVKRSVRMLEDRKLRVLATIIDEYITTGEPIGSKTIAERLNMRVSPATIRNDMSVLEQLGYLEQPHTSAGRIPTYSGYKLYIEKLMPANSLTEEEMKKIDEMLEAEMPTEEALIDKASKALAELTNCTAVAANRSPQFSVIAKVDAIPTGKRMYVLLMITSSGDIKNKVCRLEFDLTNEQLKFFSEFMTENLSGVAVDSLSDEAIERLAEAMGTYMLTLTPLLSGIKELAKGFMNTGVSVSGEKNLLSRRDVDTEEILKFLEQKNELSRLLDESFSGLQVMFGNDGNFVISNSSLIVSKVTKGSRTVGSLGLIAPLRLNYAKVIPYIEYLTNKINEIIAEDTPLIEQTLDNEN